MSVDVVNRQFLQLSSTVGRSVLSSIYPKDFEVYLMALELTDSKDRTIDYFAFPIMPESITKNEPKRVNVKMTSAGTTVLSSNSFVPEEITIKGNFGRNFQFYLSPVSPAVQGYAFSVNKGVYDLLGTKSNSLNFSTKSFSVGVKTGYGAHSILRAIVNKSNGVDGDGKPFKLYFYNLALGESYLVTIPSTGFTSSQNLDKNMIWDYNLTLNVLAPLSALNTISKQNSSKKLLAFSVMQKAVNSLGSMVASKV